MRALEEQMKRKRGKEERLLQVVGGGAFVGFFLEDAAALRVREKGEEIPERGSFLTGASS